MLPHISEHVATAHRRRGGDKGGAKLQCKIHSKSAGKSHHAKPIANRYRFRVVTLDQHQIGSFYIVTRSYLPNTRYIRPNVRFVAQEA